MSSRPKSLGVPLLIQVTGPKGSTHKCPCVMPFDCTTMDLDMFTKAYGPHIISAVHDLLQHDKFKKTLESPKLIVAP